jgi:flagellar basal body-associated protein FliL
MNTKQTSAAVLIMGILILTGIAVKHYHLHCYLPTFANKKAVEKEERILRKSMVFEFGSGRSLGIKLAIPCKDDAQRKALVANLPRIKTDLIMMNNPKKMEEQVSNRDMQGIKNQLLETINHYTQEPIEQLYFESFYYH